MLSIKQNKQYLTCLLDLPDGEITARNAMTLMGLKKDSFYRLVKKYEMPDDSSSKHGTKGTV